MLLGRWKNRRANNRSASRLPVPTAFVGTTLLASGLMSLSVATASSTGFDPEMNVDEPTTSQYWEFPSDVSTDALNQVPTLTPLPAVEQAPTLIQLPTVEEPNFTSEVANRSDQADEFIARLLPPRRLMNSQPALPTPAQQLPPSPSPGPRSIVVKQTRLASLPVLEKLTEQERLLNSLLQDSSTVATGVLTDQRVSELAKAKIQSAYAMATRGSHYVARQELIEALRMISQAKDASSGSTERTVALAAGLHALREAEDFIPRGAQLEGDLDVGVLCASHRTPVAHQADTHGVLPSVMMNRYLRFAQLQLAMSVAGEPAGSMALHAMGKLNRQLGLVEPETHRLADRRAIAYQQAALLAHNQNHLAAHELGVLLASSGHYAEAQQLFQQVAAREPNAVVYRNLARVQEKLGQTSTALANRDQARQLARQGATGTNDVQWVSPDRFAKAHSQPPTYSVAQQPRSSQIPVPGSRQQAPRPMRR